MIGFDLTEEQLELKALARRFTAQEIIPRAREYDEREIFPRDICESAFSAGLMNFGVPKEFGGPELSILDICLIAEELNYGCSGISNAIAANDLGALPLVIAGSPEQKARYLGRLTRELAFCAFAITEPAAGSENLSINHATRILSFIASTYRNAIFRNGNLGIYIYVYVYI